MSDSIFSCSVLKNPDNTIKGYNVTFLLDVANIPSTAKTVYVDGSTLINPSDLAAVKTAACTLAQAIKASYSITETVISDLNGPVTL